MAVTNIPQVFMQRLEDWSEAFEILHERYRKLNREPGKAGKMGYGRIPAVVVSFCIVLSGATSTDARTWRPITTISTAGRALAFAVIENNAVAQVLEQRGSLKDLPGVHVLIEDLPAEIEQGGLTKRDVQTDVEVRIRQAGIHVFSSIEESAKASRAAPSLYVNLNMLKFGTLPVYSYSLEIRLDQVTMSLVTSAVARTTTWTTGNIVGHMDMGQASVRDVRDTIKDRVDRFINDWLAVNPRRP